VWKPFLLGPIFRATDGFRRAGLYHPGRDRPLRISVSRHDGRRHERRAAIRYRAGHRLAQL
jgi:hypothetical protein